VLRLLGILYATDNQFEKASQLLNKVIDMDPTDDVAYRDLAATNIVAGEYDLALKNLANADRLDGNKKFRTNAIRIWALAKAGRLGEAEKVYATMDLSKPDDGSGLYLHMATKAKIEFWMGHVDEGFRWLEEAFKQREYDVLTIRFTHGYDIIRSHPRFQEFMKKVPFPPND
jgi:tetratricopeptide (TPR) repeat protein